MKLLIVPVTPLLVLALVDWTGKTGSAPPFLAAACTFLAQTLGPLLALVLIGLLLRTRRC